MDSGSLGDSGSHSGRHDRPSIPAVDSTGMQDTKMGSDIRLMRAAVRT